MKYERLYTADEVDGMIARAKAAAAQPAPVQPVGKVIASVPHLRSISVELLPEVPVPPEDSLIYAIPPAAQQEHEPENEPYVSLASVQEPVAWPCVIAEADFEQDTITLKMQCSDYKVGAGKHWLHATKPAAQPAPAKIGTIGHIDNGKATLTASILSALQATPPAATGLSKLEQLLAFCDFESKHRTPPKGKKHIALWAYEEIEHWQDRALKAEAKLAQPKQEPVYHLRQYGDVTKEQFERYAQTGSITPPAAQRTWVGLTDDEISHMWRNLPPASHDFARAIEQRLKEKNNG
jgi:hypothetical protein